MAEAKKGRDAKTIITLIGMVASLAFQLLGGWQSLLRFSVLVAIFAALEYLRRWREVVIPEEHESDEMTSV